MLGLCGWSLGRTAGGSEQKEPGGALRVSLGPGPRHPAPGEHLVLWVSVTSSKNGCFSAQVQSLRALQGASPRLC